MVEPIMYFGIGFLVAALFALLFVPLVHNRAVRLTMRRLEAATPMTIAEIRADKDQLRAEFAMSTRRLELSVEQLKARTTAQLAELGKKTDAINQLKKELGEKTAAIFSLEVRDKTLFDQMRTSEEELELKASSLRETERTLADKEAELSKLIADLGDHAVSADSQRVEVAALRTQVDALKFSAADYEHAMKDTEERLARERGELAEVTSNLTDARGKLEGLGARTGELERQLLTQTTEAELLNKRVQELENRLADQGRILAARDYEIERLRGEIEAARKSEGELRSELTDAGHRDINTVEKLKSDIAQLEAQLAAANEQRGQFETQVATLRHEAETGWASERVENALLRERINDVAAEVARLTAALEGPGSPIEALLAGAIDANEAAGQANGNGSAANNGAHGEAGAGNVESMAERKSTLADRIRALQSSASRVAQSS